MKANIDKRRLFVLAGACLFQIALLGTFANCVGTIMAQIRVQFGIPMSWVSLYNTVRGLTSAVLARSMTMAFHRSRKSAFMIGNNLILMLSFLILIPGVNVWILLVSAVLHGATFSVSAIMVVDILSGCFSDRLGFATGFAMMFSGLGGAVCNPLIATLIERYGLNVAILWTAAITLVFTLLGVTMILKGAGETLTKDGVSRRTQARVGKRKACLHADGLGVFLLCCLALLGGAVALQFNNYIVIFAQNVGLSLPNGALLASMAMIGNVTGKLAFGIGCDKLGVWRTMRLSLGCIVAALICFICMSHCLPVICLAALMFGSVFSLFMMSACQFCTLVFTKEQSGRWIGTLIGVNNLFNALASMGIGALYDSTAEFQAALWAIIAACLISALATVYLEKRAARGFSAV